MIINVGKKIRFATIVVIALLYCVTAGARRRSVVILYENDVHCAIEGYAHMAGLRDAISDTADVAIVGCGDFLQGGTAGAISHGEYITDIMAKMGYTAVTLGNHEFDYQTDRMMQLLKDANLPVTCTNFCDINTGKPYYAPYILTTIGKRKIAFIGTVTPTTLETESYALYDKQGNQLYDLKPKEVYALVQDAVNDARKHGAKYCIVLSHLGELPTDMNVDSHGLVAATRGIDAVLDGHSHSVVECSMVKNARGVQVPVTETGTKFEYVGKLLIDRKGRITTQLIAMKDIPEVNDVVQNVTDSVNALIKAITASVVCHSDFALCIDDSTGFQIVRTQETNAGDLVCDAFREVTGADIAMNNGGGIRVTVKAGDITKGDLKNLLPFDNTLEVVRVTGEQIRDLLEACVQELPEKSGDFPQVSGIRFRVDTTAVPRVSNIEVLSRKTGKYEPLVSDKTYTLGTTDYCVSGGGFYKKLADAPVVREKICMYSEALLYYVTKTLHGQIPERYRQAQGRIRYF